MPALTAVIAHTVQASFTAISCLATLLSALLLYLGSKHLSSLMKSPREAMASLSHPRLAISLLFM